MLHEIKNNILFCFTFHSNMFSFLKKKKVRKSDKKGDHHGFTSTSSDDHQQQQQQQQQQHHHHHRGENKENLIETNGKPISNKSDNDSGGFDYSQIKQYSCSDDNSFNDRTPIRTSSPLIDRTSGGGMGGGKGGLTTSIVTDTATLCDQSAEMHIDITNGKCCDSSEPSPRDLTDGVLHSCLPHKSCLSGGYTTSQISGNDLNRVLTSGYINGEENMGYLRRCVDHKTPQSPHFHRPRMKALVTGQCQKIRKIRKSDSPQHPPSSATDLKNEEPILLSRYSGGYVPDPNAPKKIEGLDWPGPVAIQAMPELMKSHRSRSESRTTDKSHHHLRTHNNSHSQCSHEPNTDDIINMQHDDDDTTITTNTINGGDEFENGDDDYDETDNVDENDIRRDLKLEKDIKIMSKLKDSSWMAHAVLEDLKNQEKFMSKQLPLDPWKSSRSPSAAVEPPRKTRYDSPKFASPSRVHTHSSNDESLLLSPTVSSSVVGGGSKRITLPRCHEPIKYDLLRHTPVLRPGYGLSPSAKAQTLPTGLVMQRSCDMDSTDLGTSSYYSTEDHNKSAKTVDVGLADGSYTQQYLDSRHAHSTRSAPNLVGNPKVYPYEELKVMTKKRLPVDVDRDRLERHLSDNEFHTLFRMSRNAFYALPEWRRIEIKKRLKLF
ncbi:unnamed protein product [Didymodactylos carnosus]|uniref:HP domain-containing protein n=1 Tax=Didymodactylos carnosus TaxID=1234261 RepID=A0A813SRZ8_9BILA|nr:unnamed protein product [Didymodactylos carnosus]CAF0798989.1 unnamed protein product [Didymodactylos carnosus]CAF3496393.1 unnamed protein product [Didymodactylos carnosus]CAF3583857.1 unnamed protein product [Didymodactylos carnosus]